MSKIPIWHEVLWNNTCIHFWIQLRLFGDSLRNDRFFTIVSFIASVMSLGMIAINRYFYIVKWNTYYKTFSKRKPLLYATAVWVYSIFLASHPLLPGKSYCFVHWPSDVYFMYFMITVCFCGPLQIQRSFLIMSGVFDEKGLLASDWNFIPLNWDLFTCKILLVLRINRKTQSPLYEINISVIRKSVPWDHSFKLPLLQGQWSDNTYVFVFVFTRRTNTYTTFNYQFNNIRL